MQFQCVSRLGSVTARQSSSGHQPNFAPLNIGRHLYSAGRPSRWAFAHILVIVRLLPSDDLIDWNSGSVHPSVHMYVRPSTKKFYSDFDLIWYSGWARPDIRTSMTLTWSKVKINVTELLKFRKLHFSRFISSAILAWSSKLKCTLTLSFLWWLIMIVWDLVYGLSGMLVVLVWLCMLIWPWSNARSRSRGNDHQPPSRVF